MRKIKRPKIGDYILVTRWGDKDPRDPWYVGFVRCVTECKTTGITCKISGDDSHRSWKHIWKISQDEGEEWMRLNATHRAT